MRSSWLVPVVFVLTAGCGIGYNERSGGDAGRGDAQTIKLDTLLYDRVSAPDGDHTDWKTFKLDSKGAITINLWWDDPKGISAVVELRDQFGKSLAKLTHDRSQRKETLGPVRLPEGGYFLQIEAKDGASVYSFEVLTGSGGVDDETPDL